MQPELSLNDLSSLHYAHLVSRKPTLYLAEYEKAFSKLRYERIRLLEIGVQDGFSMQMWRDYFPNAQIVGLDQAERPPGFPDEDRIHFQQGGQDDIGALSEAVAALGGGPFDVIIDDASHIGWFTARTFAHLFPHHLRPGGIYVLEDICTSFYECGQADSAPFYAPDIGLPGQPRNYASHTHGMVGFLKQLIDHSMAPVATRSADWTQFPIYRTTILPNIAFIEKAPDGPLRSHW